MKDARESHVLDAIDSTWRGCKWLLRVVMFTGILGSPKTLFSGSSFPCLKRVVEASPCRPPVDAKMLSLIIEDSLSTNNPWTPLKMFLTSFTGTAESVWKRKRRVKMFSWKKRKNCKFADETSSAKTYSTSNRVLGTFKLKYSFFLVNKSFVQEYLTTQNGVCEFLRGKGGDTIKKWRVKIIF